MSQNPYAPPLADVNSELPRTRRRPALVWVICLLCIFGVVVALSSVYLVTRGSLRISSPAENFYQKFGALNYFGVLVSGLLCLLLAISLFRLKKSAFYYAFLLFVANTVKTIAYFSQLHAMGQSAVRLVLGPCVTLLIVWYVWHLRRRGVVS
jgi:hypothetical protein